MSDACLNSHRLSPALILASQSEQRLALLRQLALEPVCLPCDVDEAAKPAEKATELVLRLARLKAEACIKTSEYKSMAAGASSHCVVLAADTVIEIDGNILGKPRNQADAMQMLQSLSAREHFVHSGVCVHSTLEHQFQHVLVTTTVRFTSIDLLTAKRYWQSGEPMGKAGGYAIQGLGAQFVNHMSGSYSNAVGLPCLLYTSPSPRDRG